MTKKELIKKIENANCKSDLEELENRILWIFGAGEQELKAYKKIKKRYEELNVEVDESFERTIKQCERDYLNNNDEENNKKDDNFDKEVEQALNNDIEIEEDVIDEEDEVSEQDEIFGDLIYKIEDCEDEDKLFNEYRQEIIENFEIGSKDKRELLNTLKQRYKEIVNVDDLRIELKKQIKNTKTTDKISKIQTKINMIFGLEERVLTNLATKKYDELAKKEKEKEFKRKLETNATNINFEENYKNDTDKTDKIIENTIKNLESKSTKNKKSEVVRDIENMIEVVDTVKDLREIKKDINSKKREYLLDDAQKVDLIAKVDAKIKKISSEEDDYEITDKQLIADENAAIPFVAYRKMRYDFDITKTMFEVYSVLCLKANYFGVVEYASMKDIAEFLNKNSRNAVLEAIKKLEEKEFIEVDRSSVINKYQIKDYEESFEEKSLGVFYITKKMIKRLTKADISLKYYRLAFFLFATKQHMPNNKSKRGIKQETLKNTMNAVSIKEVRKIVKDLTGIIFKSIENFNKKVNRFKMKDKKLYFEFYTTKLGVFDANITEDEKEEMKANIKFKDILAILTNLKISKSWFNIKKMFTFFKNISEATFETIKTIVQKVNIDSKYNSVNFVKTLIERSENKLKRQFKQLA